MFFQFLSAEVVQLTLHQLFVILRHTGILIHYSIIPFKNARAVTSYGRLDRHAMWFGERPLLRFCRFFA
jgi:hypothetical protein